MVRHEGNFAVQMNLKNRKYKCKKTVVYAAVNGDMYSEHIENSKEKKGDIIQQHIDI